MRFHTKLLATAVATLPLACSSSSSGAADLKASDLDGTWVVTAKRTASTCIGPVIGETEDVTITITVSGSKVRISQAGQPDLEFDLAGSRVRGQIVDEFSGFRQTQTFDFGIVSGRIDGTQIDVEVEISTGQELCRETYQLTGIRQSTSTGPSTSNFNGTWNLQTTVTAVSNPSKCDANVNDVDTIEATIAINGSTATITPAGEPAVTLNVVNGRLQGTDTQDVGFGIIGTTVFDLGLVTADTFNGTITTTLTFDGAVVCEQTFSVAGSRIVL